MSSSLMRSYGGCAKASDEAENPYYRGNVRRTLSEWGESKDRRMLLHDGIHKC
jgi:hypothetical protein